MCKLGKQTKNLHASQFGLPVLTTHRTAANLNAWRVPNVQLLELNVAPMGYTFDLGIHGPWVPMGNSSPRQHSSSQHSCGVAFSSLPSE